MKSGELTEVRLRQFRHGETDLAFEERGKGRPVLCLHGFPDTVRTFDMLASGLAGEGCRAIVPALRGYPPSSIPPDGDYSPVALANDVVSLLDHLGLERAAIVGHDWGAVAGYAACALRPDRISAFVALAIPPLGLLPNGPRERVVRPHNIYLGWGSASNAWLRLNDFAEIDRLYRKWSPHWAVPKADLAAVKEALKPQARSRAAVDYYSARTPRQDRERLLKSIATPTLVVYGSDEPEVRKDAFRAAAKMTGPGSGVIELEGVGHWPHREAPQRVLELTLDFLAPRSSLQ